MTAGEHHARARWDRRGDIGLRVVAAVPLAYAAASLWAMALARLLPLPPVEASVAGALVALGLCAVLAMWAFAARSGWRATWTIVAAGAVGGGIAWASIGATGRL
ncbi:hypothetical protein [Sphingomonas rubra]|uniref:Iron uptake protein n=1 Tax=Sphingomonas rubra TaxID=634430 RepID=A0A1I5RQL3_9SPHN|nr:hypothetical protein [Sphingomonas rubra]SFP60832.1 hypothetical protein SAMN04488241_10450 [Sphingomonas rubra]